MLDMDNQLDTYPAGGGGTPYCGGGTTGGGMLGGGADISPRCFLLYSLLSAVITWKEEIHEFIELLKWWTVGQGEKWSVIGHVSLKKFCVK